MMAAPPTPAADRVVARAVVAIGEDPFYALGFEMTEPGIERHLGDDVGIGVGREGLVRGEQTGAVAAVIGIGVSLVVGEGGAVRVVAADDRLRAFDRNTGPQAVAEILDEAGLGIAAPVEAGHVLRVDRHRYLFGPRHDAFRIRGQQAPGLTGQEVEAPGILIDLREELPETRLVAVAFARVRDVTGAEEIAFNIGREMRVGIDIGRHHAGQAALTGAEAQLGFLGLGGCC